MKTNRLQRIGRLGSTLLPVGLSLGFSLGAFGAQAAEYGVGVALKGAEIFIPINLNPQLRIEPSFSIDRNEFQISINKSTTDTYRLKTGVFSIRPVNEGVNILSGLRIGYQLNRRLNDSGGTHRDESSQGFIIEPTLAAEYFPIKHLAIGAEVFLSYTRLFARTDDGFDSTQTSTATNISVKYFY